MKTIWITRDRQGKKAFSRRPRYIAMHDIFTGDLINMPKGKVRTIRKFTCSVDGGECVGYPRKMKVRS